MATEDSLILANKTLSDELSERIGVSFRWTWDDRFEALLSEFTLEDFTTIESTLENHFGQSWDQITIESAPDKTIEELGSFAELRKGQRVYISEDGENHCFLAAVWPWGDGKTVSLRIMSAD